MDTRIDDGEMVPASISSLKTALIVVDVATATAPSLGTVDVTVGATVSPGGAFLSLVQPCTPAATMASSASVNGHERSE
jgi:hypothetical protein